MRTRIFTISVVILLSCAIAQGQRSRSNTSKTEKPVPRATDDERRKSIEQRMLKGEYHHDGSGELMYIGTIDSVPALLRVLRDNPPFVPKVEPLPPPLPGASPNAPPAKPKKMFICTYHHALSALRKITGQTSLVDYEEWLAWWETYQAKNK